MRRRLLTEQDRQEWASYVRHVAPLGRPPLPVLPAEPTPPAAADLPMAAAPRPAPPPSPRRALPQLDVGAQPSGIDRATWARFRAGKLAVSRVLDLHGRTLDRAYGELHAFVAQASADGVRCVEVITGRGSGDTGTIRRELPHWLNGPALRHLLLAVAHPHAANPGSLRLLLRRRR